MSRSLIVIDIQNDYFSGGQLPLWQAEDVEARIVTAIGRARAQEDKVILVQHVSANASGLFARGSDGAAIRPAILACAGDAPVVTKQVADAFQDTDLAQHLAGTKELLIIGMMTQNCVVFTALSRSADQFVIRVLCDLCTAPTETVHRIALNALGSKLDLAESSDVWPAKQTARGVIPR